jgi:hypothetical protein
MEAGDFREHGSSREVVKYHVMIYKVYFIATYKIEF